MVEPVDKRLGFGLRSVEKYQGVLVEPPFCCKKMAYIFFPHVWLGKKYSGLDNALNYLNLFEMIFG